MLFLPITLTLLFAKFPTFDTLLNTDLRIKLKSIRHCNCQSLIIVRGNVKLYLLDELESIKLDESKLSPSERERLLFIQKLTTEADEIVKAAGFNIDDVKMIIITIVSYSYNVTLLTYWVHTGAE
jgi:hypothetical protein